MSEWTSRLPPRNSAGSPVDGPPGVVDGNGAVRSGRAATVVSAG